MPEVEVDDPFMPWPYAKPYGKVKVKIKRKYVRKKKEAWHGRELPQVGNYKGDVVGRYFPEDRSEGDRRT